MKVSILFCFILALMSCSAKQANSDRSAEDETYPVVIQLSNALLNPQDEILLSELADSVSYIPLETKDNCMLKNYPFYTFTSRHIMYLNYCFDWSGKFLFKVGKLGQGPGEEPAEIISKVTYCDGNFYTEGQKIIEYDSLGAFTGKELSIYTVDKLKSIVSSRSMAYTVALNSLGKKIFLYSYPDTLFVMNKDFELVDKYFVMPWKSEEQPFFLSGNGPYSRYMTYYKDNILFYNNFRDTVFLVTETERHPRWILEYGDLEPPEELLYQFNKLYSVAFKDWEKGDLENTPLVKLMDHKYGVMSVNESDNYVFIFASKMIAFRKLRDLPHDPPILIYYNKKTKEIKSTYKIKDDLTGYSSFLPKYGLVDEKMIDSFWPHECEEWLQKKAETIPQLVQFAKRDFTEDNPIVMIVHLKK